MQNTAAKNLQLFLEESLISHKFPAPHDRETEPQYTARVIYPFIVRTLSARLKSREVWVKGDGASQRAYSKSFLGFSFHPDISVGESSSSYWCAEVKLSRSGFSGDVISKALGQSLIYHEVFPNVTVILVDFKKSRTPQVSRSHVFSDWLTVIEIKNFALV